MVEDLSQLYTRPGFLLRRVHQIYVAIFEDCFDQLNLSPVQYSVLIALNSINGMNQNDLARAIGVNKVSVSQIVQGLEERGWISREPIPGDRRHRQVALTAAGRKTLARTKAMADETYALQMAPLNAAQRKTLAALLQQMAEALEPHARSPFQPAMAAATAE